MRISDWSSDVCSSDLDNADLPFPLVLTGPRSAAAYFEQIDQFLRLALGDGVARHYEIIVEDPVAVARRMSRGMSKVREHRLDSRSEEHTSELQSLMRISYAVFCLKKKKRTLTYHEPTAE